eukprot:346399-Pelagomonas_calceolata.AAC.1
MRSNTKEVGCEDNIKKIARAGVGLSARNMAVPLGRNHDIEALLRHGEQNNWMSVSDEVAVPTYVVIQKLVAEQVGKMNGHASPGFDCVAAPFIKPQCSVPN